MKIIKAGILTTIQDAGRRGHRAAGIGPAGAMDPFAFAMLNRLLGNEMHEAVIEMHFPAAEILFEEEAVFAITGADFDARLNESVIPCWKALMAKPGDVLKFHAPRKGCRVYFSVKRGFECDSWLGSCSSNLSVQKGGYHGRALKKDDVLQLKNKDAFLNYQEAETSAALLAQVYHGKMIHCLAGPEFDLLTEEAKEILLSVPFTIDIRSNRMGYRLQQEKLSVKEAAGNMWSSAVCTGTVQLVPGGELIILMADQQTTGGYPRVLTVAGADLPQLAQLKPGDELSFTMITAEEAEERLVSLHQMIHYTALDENYY